MVANVGNTILGTFNAVQNASVNRERIAKARLDREITQDAFMKQQGYDRAKKFEAYAIRNGYTSAGSQDFDFNKMGADLYSDDPARRQIAEQETKFRAKTHRLRSNKSPETVTAIWRFQEAIKIAMK
jgi:hypothetical protein